MLIHSTHQYIQHVNTLNISLRPIHQNAPVVLPAMYRHQSYISRLFIVSYMIADGIIYHNHYYVCWTVLCWMYWYWYWCIWYVFYKLGYIFAIEWARLCNHWGAAGIWWKRWAGDFWHHQWIPSHSSSISRQVSAGGSRYPPLIIQRQLDLSLLSLSASAVSISTSHQTPSPSMAHQRSAIMTPHQTLSLYPPRSLMTSSETRVQNQKHLQSLWKVHLLPLCIISPVQVY